MRNCSFYPRGLSAVVPLLFVLALGSGFGSAAAQTATGGWTSRGAAAPRDASRLAELGPRIAPFDPYSSSPYPTTPYAPMPNPGMTAAPPGSLGAPYAAGPPPGVPGPVPTLPPAYGTGPPAVFPGQAAPLMPPGGYGGTYPGQGSSGMFGPGSVFGAPPTGPYMRFFQNVKISHTWLAGEDSSEPRYLDINDSAVSLTAAFPNFLYGSSPLLVTPGGVLHFWDGPNTGGLVLADLPAQAYSTYLDFAWTPALQALPQFTGELGARVGVYTDFNTFSIASVRVQGFGLGVVQIAPAVKVKFGVLYLDRVRIKVLPAGGILWEPNPNTRFDIYFPEPKLAQYLTTIGNTEFWWYVAGEYGGGSWTVERQTGAVIGDSNQIDINDLRASLGLEWTRLSGFKGFVEVGFVFDREVLYRENPGHDFKPRDTVMVRGGLVF